MTARTVVENFDAVENFRSGVSPVSDLASVIGACALQRAPKKGLRSLSRGGLTPNESTIQALQPGTDISLKPVQFQVFGSFENAAE